MSTYYNEIDPFARKWLRDLMRAGIIPGGFIDNRPIQEVRADELQRAGFTVCHFFAGIGGWAYALRLAGWPDDEPIWTGSCPCQPFSIGNVKPESQKGFNDPRHLWPAWFRLADECNPPAILGEQVAGSIGKGWWDVVACDLESADYACAAAVLPACGYGADHERKRLYWVADSGRPRREGFERRAGISGGARAALSEHGDPLAIARRALAGDFTDLLPCNGVSVQVARNEIKGYGNAIVPEVAAQFCRSALSW